MPKQYRKTSRVSLKRKVNRRRTKKGGASVSGDNNHKYEWEKELWTHFNIDNSEGFSLLDIKTVLDNVVAPGASLRPSVPYLRPHLTRLGLEKKERLKEIVNGTLKAVNPDGKYPLGNILLSPEEKITKKNIQKIIDNFREKTMDYVQFDENFQGRDKDFILLEELNIIKDFIDYFSPEGSSPVELPEAELSEAEVNAAAQLFGAIEQIEQIEPKDTICSGCSIMGGYKKKYKRKSKKKSNRKSKRGGNGCGTGKRGGHGHAIHKKK